MDAQYRTASLAAANLADAFGHLQRWAETRSPGLSIASVTFIADPERDGVTAFVVYTERQQNRVVPVQLELLKEQTRPAWLTDKLLRGNAYEAMFAYLDRHPETGGLALSRWAQQYFPITDDYGHKVRTRWLNRGKK